MNFFEGADPTHKGSDPTHIPNYASIDDLVVYRHIAFTICV